MKEQTYTRKRLMAFNPVSRSLSGSLEIELLMRTTWRKRKPALQQPLQ